MSVSIQSIVTKKRINWNNEPLLQTALENLKNHGLRKTAHKLNVSVCALRFALKRRGIRASAITYTKRTNVRIADKIGAISRVSTPNPLQAEEALEHKPDNGCCWPMGDLANGNFRYCGKPKRLGKSYCEQCYKRAYVPNSALTESAVNRIWLGIRDNSSGPATQITKRGHRSLTSLNRLRA